MCLITVQNRALEVTFAPQMNGLQEFEGRSSRLRCVCQEIVQPMVLWRLHWFKCLSWSIGEV
jgi:hypothetical protein